MKLALIVKMIRPLCLPGSIIARKVSASEFSNSLGPQKTLPLSKEVEHWPLTIPREKLVKIGAEVVRHGRTVTFQLAEVVIPKSLFAEILRLIDRLRPAPLPP